MLTFKEFLKTDAGKEGLDPEFAARLSVSGVTIESLPNLTRFARDRWPDNFPKD